MSCRILKKLFILLFVLILNIFILKDIFAEENSIEDLGSLDQQARTLYSDLKDSINNLSEAKNVLKDLSIKKVNKIKNTINYAIQLKKQNLDSINTINKINQMSLGFSQLKDDVTGINIDLSTALDMNELEAALKSLEELDFEEITQEIEKSIKESTELIEEVIAEVAEAIAQTASDVMDEINSALGTNLNVETYAWLWGIDGVSSSTTFSDAVEIFNEAWGTEFSEDEVQGLMAYDTCWLYDLCE